MSALKILFLSMDRDDRIANHFDDFRNALCKQAIVTVLKQKKFARRPNDQHMDYLNGKLAYEKLMPDNLDYDCIICDSMFLWMFEDWKGVEIPVMVIIEDQHNVVPKIQIDLAITHGHIILHRYQFNKFHKNLPPQTKKLWFPHSVNINSFKDWEQPKEYGVLLSGAVTPVYQTRVEVLNALKNEPYFKHLQRPIDYTENPWPVGSDYSKELNKAWLSVSCGAKVLYPVMKFFEIPASNSVLYSNYFDELGNLGFVPNKNMIVIDERNICGQAETLLEDKENLNRIAKAGYDLIHSRHTNYIRAKELVSYIKNEVI